MKVIYPELEREYEEINVRLSFSCKIRNEKRYS